MNQLKRKKIEILEDAVVIYDSGEKETYNAISITNRGIFTGHLINHHEFVEGGGIPKNNIKKIYSRKKRMVYKKYF
jgi:hypothetical protein